MTSNNISQLTFDKKKSLIDMAFDEAFAEAQKAFDEGEIPVGAVIVKDGEIIARAHNRREADKSPTAHAEILAIELAAKKLSDWRLTGCDLYVTLEPCIMCSGAIINSRIRRVYFAAYDHQAGAAGGNVNVFGTREVYGGFHEMRAAQILKDFFNLHRKED